ncbi:MAG: hypothetical protein P8Y69_15230 [Gammaproteobacteria bacterium]|jgi:hypothetical protein
MGGPVIERRRQLRRAKQQQRERDRDAGLGLYQVKLPREDLDRLKAGMRQNRFVRKLRRFLRRELVALDDYPGLKLLCWNRSVDFITREEAFDLYELNWRLVDTASLTDEERALIDDLADEFGQGLINA